MSEYVIIADSSSDFTQDLRERFDVSDCINGVLYCPDGTSELIDVDWKSRSPEEYYSSMKEHKVLYTTAAPPIGQILEKFEKHLAEGKDILSISMSSALSSTYSNCLAAASELKDKYPERKIICVDSKRYSTCMCILLISASLHREQGMTIEENAAALEQERECIHQMGSMDDMFFLVKTGRINNFKAFFASIAGLNILADINDRGISEVLAKFKGKRDTTEAILRYAEKTVINPQDQIMFIAHSNRKEAAKMLAARVKEKFNPKEIIIKEIGIGCGAAIGPGMCAMFYTGTKISKECEEEKKIMNEIAEQIKAVKQENNNG